MEPLFNITATYGMWIWCTWMSHSSLQTVHLIHCSACGSLLKHQAANYSGISNYKTWFINNLILYILSKWAILCNYGSVTDHSTDVQIDFIKFISC
jgi:hypothetical protein